MSTTTTTGSPRRSRPRLRLLPDASEPHPPRREPAGTAVGAVDNVGAAVRNLGHGEKPPASPEGATVLVAGAQPAARARMLRQLRELLPGGTPFVEAHETWEVVAHAPDSRLVVLTGDLTDLSARGLMRVLSRRHPLLPVISVGGCTDGAAVSTLGVASL